jgi:para-nitrobenzyl esterase
MLPRCSVTPFLKQCSGIRMPTDVVVDTPFGSVRGRSDGRMLRFGGVPYARAGRLQAPEPTRWTEPLDATAPGAAPPQVAGGLDLVPGMIPARQSEDCLTAEIWTPSVDGRQPVLVWVPGGSYRIGGASLPTYDGTRLAEQSTVVVGVNYRLGSLGWLAADGVPSNLGLRDLLAALAWVRDVAPAFGGDPDRIVVMGESAGAGMIAHLLVAMAKLATRAPVISGAILQSGAPAATLDAPTAAWVGEQVLDAAGARDVAALRSMPLAAILDAQERTVSAALGKVGMMPFHPWIDGDLLDAPAFRGTLAPIPLVVGTNTHEMELFRDQVPALPEELAMSFLARKALSLGITDEARVRAALHACDGDLVEAVADLDLHVPNELIARAHEQRGHPVWRYRFDWQSPVGGACHALDLPFTFGTLDVDGWRDFAGAHDPQADALSLRMRTAWTSFARTGQPVDDVVGPWPQRGVVRLGADGSSDDVDDVARRVGVWLGDGGAS